MTAGSSQKNLTPRKRQCLEWLGRGLTNRAIAKKLGITVATVALHLGNARIKLGAATCEQALGSPSSTA